jgi:hypothetical protein
VNDPETPSLSKAFAYRLYYDSAPGGGVNNFTGRYDGTISAMSWRSYTQSGKETYNYLYDGLSRLKSAEYYTGSDNTASGAFKESGITYDLNGNIKTLSRTSVNGTVVDNLTYTYSASKGNQLDRVDDAGTARFGQYDFYDGAKQAGEYVYDANGNLTADRNKRITIVNNYLNLPDSVSFGSGKAVRWRYDCSGSKLSKVYYR